MITEAAVIGAGPAGLLAAEEIARQGFSVDIFEEHRKVGYPVHCAGMVSVEGFERLGVMPDPVFHQNTVYGGRIFSPDGNCITIRDQKPRAYIIDRGRFDSFLAERAVNRGVRINTGKRVNRIKFKEGRAHKLVMDDSEIQAEIFIDAEGAKGRVLSRSGVDTCQESILNGFNVEMNVDYVESDMVEVWFDNEVAKDFFTWVIPLSENKVRCGLGTSRPDGARSLIKFVEKRFGEKPDNVIHSGLLCTGGPVKKTVYPRLMLVGDVAGQVKPTTGGGLVIGGLCAQMAGRIAAKALGYEEHDLEEYESKWRKSYDSELQTMLYLRRLLNHLSNERMNRLFHIAIEENLEKKFTKLVEEGDMDMQAGVIKRGLRDPLIIGALMRTVGRLALSELFSVFKLR
ncbi:geranylgeranyl reductase family protein [Candidatus Bathyarchaeota archaeon]|nr:geranylgeranyl reductase family protein [Candidatus Bathyarchaeota archaeon]